MFPCKYAELANLPAFAPGLIVGVIVRDAAHRPSKREVYHESKELECFRESMPPRKRGVSGYAAKEARQNKELGYYRDSIQTERTLAHARPIALNAARVHVL